MRLRGRFTLWFSLAALLPIAAAALVTRDVVSRSYTKDFKQLRDSTVQTLSRELDRLERSVVHMVEDVIDEERRHPLVGGVLLEMNKTGGSLSPRFERKIRNDGNNYKRGLGLDLLFVLDGEDRVLAAPHADPAHGTVNREHRARMRAANDKAYYVQEEIWTSDQVSRGLMVAAARERAQGRHRVAIVGGRQLDSELLDTIRQSERIDARIIDSNGRELVPSARPWETEAVHSVSVPLIGPDGQALAHIEVIISKAELTYVLEQVTIAALVLAVAAVLATILLGFFVARRMTANLERLVEGAQAAARGDLEHRVRVKSKDEIGALAGSFNSMMEDLQTATERLVIAERIAAWQEIARRLAHEIKNPLTPIQMSVETMRKGWKKKHPSFEEIFEESTATILEETARLKRIVSEFSKFARMPKPMVMPIDLSEAVASSLALYKGSVAIASDLAENLPPILADRDQLTQMLLNLLENARDAVEMRTPGSAEDSGNGGADSGNGGANEGDDGESGRVAVTTRLTDRGDRVQVVVEDNGPGIPDDLKERLFTPYFTTKQGGTGLGLAIVHRMVSDHGGRIAVSDRPGGGARFTVEFPVSDEE